MRRRRCLALTLKLGGAAWLSRPAPAPAQPGPGRDWWAWGNDGACGPAGELAWPAPPVGEPVAGAGALWWLDATPTLHRWSRDGAHTPHRLATLPHAWAPAPHGEGVLLAQGQALQLLGADGTPRQHWPVRDLAGRRLASASDALAHETRRSLVLPVPGLGEVWEISLDPQAPPLHDGLVHDHRMGEAVSRPGLYGIQRLPLRAEGDEVPRRLFGAAGQAWVCGPVAGGVSILNLDVRRRLATLPASLSLQAWQAHSRRLWLRQGQRLQAFDTQRWQAGPALALPDGALHVVAEGARLWLRDEAGQLWRSDDASAWEPAGRARGWALSAQGELALLDERWPAWVRGLQPVW